MRYRDPFARRDTHTRCRLSMVESLEQGVESAGLSLTQINNVRIKLPSDMMKAQCTTYAECLLSAFTCGVCCTLVCVWVDHGHVDQIKTKGNVYHSEIRITYVFRAHQKRQSQPHVYAKRKEKRRPPHIWWNIRCSLLILVWHVFELAQRRPHA